MHFQGRSIKMVKSFKLPVKDNRRLRKPNDVSQFFFLYIFLEQFVFAVVIFAILSSGLFKSLSLRGNSYKSSIGCKAILKPCARIQPAKKRAHIQNSKTKIYGGAARLDKIARVLQADGKGFGQAKLKCRPNRVFSTMPILRYHFSSGRKVS